MDVNFSPQGPPDVVLPDPDPQLVADLEAAGDDLEAVAAVVAADPTFLEGWARLGELSAVDLGDRRRGVVEAYAYFRVGYHRGLDALRKHGWKGNGFVRWDAEANRGFLRCLQGLGRMAGEIGEENEASRCAEFLMQLDPSGPWRA